MKNKEYAILKMKEVAKAINEIIALMETGGIPQNEEWVKAARPLNEIIAIMGNYAKYKDEEVGKTKWLIKKRK